MDNLVFLSFLILYSYDIAFDFDKNLFLNMSFHLYPLVAFAPFDELCIEILLLTLFEYPT